MLQLDVLCFFFFFQAEDGIRDYKVTGVQTCALPICMVARRLPSRARASSSSVRACSASVGSTLLQSMAELAPPLADRKSTRLNSSHLVISYAVFCLKKKTKHSHVLFYISSIVYTPSS